MEAITIKDTQAITDQDVLKAGVEQKASDTDTTWTSAIDHDTHNFWRLAYNQRDEKLFHNLS
jgi:hypothetical protein